MHGVLRAHLGLAIASTRLDLRQLLAAAPVVLAVGRRAVLRSSLSLVRHGGRFACDAWWIIFG
jgi:hypothetical protein